MSSEITVKPSHNPRYTLFIPWTREDYLYDVLHCIDELVITRSDFEVVFYIDTDNPSLYDKLHSWTILQIGMGWNGIKLIKSGKPQPPNTHTSDVIERRARIVQMKEDSKRYIADSQYVFGLEDDTIFPPHSFTRLKDMFDRHEDLGYAQGVQMGRWGLSVIGAWKVDDIEDITQMGTVEMPYEPVEMYIDGGGFFCYLTPTKLYKEHKYYWNDECFGPDATYGIELRKKGYTCMMDTAIVCPHLTDQGRLVPNARNVVSVKWNKRHTRWVREDQETNVAEPSNGEPSAIPPEQPENPNKEAS